MRTNNKLKPHDTAYGSQTWVTLVRGECSHHCAIPAPIFISKTYCDFPAVQTFGNCWLGFELQLQWSAHTGMGNILLRILYTKYVIDKQALLVSLISFPYGGPFWG